MGLINFFTGKTDDGMKKMLMVHYWGLPDFYFRQSCYMIVNTKKDALEFKDFIGKDTVPVLLPFRKITGVGSVSAKEIEAQRIIGKNRKGDLYTDTAFKVLRTFDGKERKKCKFLYIINYQSDDEIKSIILRENGNLNYSRFQNTLKQYIPERTIDKKETIL